MRLIRDGWVDEHEALKALQRRASDIWPQDMHGPKRADLSLWTLEASRVRVAEGDALVMGFAVLLKREGADCRLDAVFIDPEGWRRGFGRALVEDAADLARAEGAETMTVRAYGAGERFYTRLGFVASALAKASPRADELLRLNLH